MAQRKKQVQMGSTMMWAAVSERGGSLKLAGEEACFYF